MSGLQLDSAVLTEECPCTECRFRERCASERWACAAFSMFLNGESQKRWAIAPRAPTRAIYSAVLGEPRPNGRPRKRGPGRPITPTPPRARAGELLKASEKAKGARGSGSNQHRKVVPSQAASAAKTLAQLGLSETQSAAPDARAVMQRLMREVLG